MTIVARGGHNPLGFLANIASLREVMGGNASQISEGKTPKELRRLLKRYIARQVYRRLSDPHEIALAT